MSISLAIQACMWVCVILCILAINIHFKRGIEETNREHGRMIWEMNREHEKKMEKISADRGDVPNESRKGAQHENSSAANKAAPHENTDATKKALPDTNDGKAEQKELIDSFLEWEKRC